MRQIAVSKLVRAQTDSILSLVDAYIIKRGGFATGSVLELQFALRRFTGYAAKQAGTVVHFSYVKGDAGPGRLVSAEWRPAEDAPFPTFHGKIDTVSRGNGYCSLSISGAYWPPAELPGAVFDAALGIRIVRATLAGFLREVVEAVESDHRFHASM
jgi:hypothetical protein